MERLHATYWIETPIPVEKAAAILAGEQSSGTFVAVPGESEALKERFAARVEQIEVVETVSSPAIPSKELEGKQFTRARVTVSWSVENFRHNLPVLMSTLEGNLYELRQFTGLKLLDFTVPKLWSQRFRGPSFGVEGCRDLVGVQGRPLIGTIIKPSIGLSPEETGEIVKQLLEAGIDFIKDDELQGSASNSPFDRRVEVIMRVIRDYADHTGRKPMYAFNISDELEPMKRHYEKIVNEGGNCAMISLNTVGLTAVKAMCDIGKLAIHGHRNGWGMINRHPLLGVEFSAYQKFWRLSGVDQIHVNGIQNKFWEADESVVRSIQACMEPFVGKGILPVVSSGQWGGQAFRTYELTKTVDLLYLAGGGILAHPGGPASGVKALHQAWNGAVKGKTLEETAAECPEFAMSVQKFMKHEGVDQGKERKA